jgi:hypothetical protein
VINVVGGMSAWNAQHVPTTRDEEPAPVRA